MKNVSWEEAANSCNNVFRKYHNESVENYVKDCAMNSLPPCLTQMMATCLHEKLPYDDPDVVVLRNAYQQLIEKGFVGDFGDEN